jgi:hypothetical protein
MTLKAHLEQTITDLTNVEMPSWKHSESCGDYSPALITGLCV